MTFDDIQNAASKQPLQLDSIYVHGIFYKNLIEVTDIALSILGNSDIRCISYLLYIQVILPISML